MNNKDILAWLYDNHRGLMTVFDMVEEEEEYHGMKVWSLGITGSSDIEPVYVGWPQLVFEDKNGLRLATFEEVDEYLDYWGEKHPEGEK